jgi:arylsulfatase A-like enzyme
MPPYVYAENKRLIEQPTSFTSGQKPDTAYAGAFWRGGLQSPSFDFYGVLPHFTQKAKSFIQQQSNQHPFFLYLPLPAPHTPWMPTGDFRGKSNAGEYGDFVQQVDASVGSILQTIDSMGLSKNTIVVFTSDNGPYWREDHVQQFNHRAAGEWRGMKGDSYEAGHRVPFLVKWPGKIEEGKTNEALISQVDFFATVADLLKDQSLGARTEDSYSMLPVWLGRASAVEGQTAVVQSSSMGYFAVRSGEWKLILGLGSGGFSHPKQYVPVAGGPSGQLYNLNKDPQEKNNLYADHPEIVDRLKKLLEEIRAK